jgi:2-methylaconitate cis-trans-isomerase PrpF
LDGLGSGSPSLSKVCIVTPSSLSYADVDYTFAAVGIGSSSVDFSGNCGNMSSAIGPFAYNTGLVPRTDKPDVTVHIRNTNTGKLIDSKFRLTNDRTEAATSGDLSIDGVTGPGAQIQLTFLEPADSRTGALLPTGNVVDTFDGIEATCIDASNPCIFIRATDLGLNGTELPPQMLDNPDLLHRLEALRVLGAKAMGLCKDPEEAPPQAVPKIALVSRPTQHRVLDGGTVEKEAADLIVRVISHRQPHRALPLTVGSCTAVAALVEGGIVESLLDGLAAARSRILRIGHPGGVIPAVVDLGDGSRDVRAVEFCTTARRLVEGTFYY